jgi:SPP1 family predicted phage head-tail adaptor
MATAQTPDLIRAGRLTERLAFWAPVEVPDNQGGTVTTYPAATFEVWGDVEPLTGSELLAASQMSSQSTVRIRMYYRPDVSVKQRIIWATRGKTRTLEVDSYRTLDRANVGMEVLCSEVLT